MAEDYEKLARAAGWHGPDAQGWWYRRYKRGDSAALRSLHKHAPEQRRNYLQTHGYQRLHALTALHAVTFDLRKDVLSDELNPPKGDQND